MRYIYSIRALNYQNSAIKGLQAILPNLNNENCHAAFATASLLYMCVFATFATNSMGQKQPGVENLLEGFRLIRGMSEILKKYEEAIACGPLGNLLLLSHHQSRTPLLATLERELTSMELPEDADHSVRALCQGEITTMTDWIQHATVTSEKPEQRLAVTWLFAPSEGFMNLLSRRNRSAIQILVFYCRILNAAGRDCWYLKGWGECLLRDISRHA